MKTLLITALLIVSFPAAAQQASDDASRAHPLIQADLTAEHSLAELQLLVTPLTVEQLTQEATKWQLLLQDSIAKIVGLKVAALKTEGAALDRIHEDIAREAVRREELTDKFLAIVESMELKGADPELVKGYRDFVSGAMASELQATDFRTLAAGLIEWASSRDGGIGFVIGTLIVLASLFALLLVARLVRSLARRGLRRVSNLSQLMQDFLLKTIFWLTFAIGLMVVLSVLGVNITPLFAVLGGASFILAFAMQETLGNLAAGLMIMINKPFDVGDLVDTNGVLGEVEAVSIVSTTVRTLDNQVVILPNSAVWGSIITNVTVSPIRRVDMVFGIGYSDDIETAQNVLERLVTEHPQILEDPAPTIKVHELADSSVNFICRPWTKTEHYWDVYWDLTRQVKENFDASGVSIPFPQSDVHLFQEA